MALMFVAKISTKIQTPKYFVYLFVYTPERVCSFHAYAAPPQPPQRGIVFVFFPFVPIGFFSGDSPLKALFLL